MRIPDLFLHCSVYLYPSKADAENGVRAGGSGFLVALPVHEIEGGAFQIFAVTNAHVVESGSCCVRVNTTDDKFEVFEFLESNWFKHPAGDDLAITTMPAMNPARYRFRMLQPENLLTKDYAERVGIGPGDDVFVAGRFINSEGKQRNMPALRFGNISQVPIEPLLVDRAGGKFPQESYLVEARSISGYSGSPVFVMLLPIFRRPEGKETPSPPEKDVILLLGVTWGYITNWEPVCGPNGQPLDYGQQVRVNTGMMGIVPAWKLQEMLDHQVVQDFMKTMTERFNKIHGTAPQTTPTAAVPAKPERPTTPIEGDDQHKERFTALLDAAVGKPKQGG